MTQVSEYTASLWTLACVLLSVALTAPGCCHEETVYEGTPLIMTSQQPIPTVYLADSISTGFVRFSPKGRKALLSHGNSITIADEGEVVKRIHLYRFDLEQGDSHSLSRYRDESFSYSSSRFSPIAPKIALSLYPDSASHVNAKDIYTYNWKRNTLKKKTHFSDAEWATHPVYSPDGTQLAYVVNVNARAKPHIRIESVNQSDTARVLTAIDMPRSSTPFAFHPDGSYVVHSESNVLKRTALDTRTTRSLTETPVSPSHIVFSRDGSRIAFLSKPENQPESIYVLNPNTGEQRQLTPYGDIDRDSVEFRNVHFTSDSHTLVFARRKTESSARVQIHRLDLQKNSSEFIARGASPRVRGGLSSSVLAATSARNEILYVSESSYEERVCPTF